MLLLPLNQQELGPLQHSTYSSRQGLIRPGA